MNCSKVHFNYFILTHDVLINELTCEIEVKFCVGLGFHSFF